MADILRGHSTTTWTEFCHFLTPPAWKFFIPSTWTKTYIFLTPSPSTHLFQVASYWMPSEQCQRSIKRAIKIWAFLEKKKFQFLNSLKNSKIVIWHMCLAIWKSFNNIFWLKATFKKEMYLTKKELTSIIHPSRRNWLNTVYDRNRYFGLGPKPKTKLADTFGLYRNRYRNHISKGESSYC